MAMYQYEALSINGDIIKGKMEADNEDSVRASLREKRYYTQNIKKYSALSNIDLLKFKSVSIRDIAVFCRQFSFTIKAGMNILKAIEIVIDQTGNKRFKEILFQVKTDIEKGSTFSAALSKHKDFPEMLVNMIEVGEASGTLDDVMVRMADYYDNSYKLQKKIRGALIYPVFTLLTAVVVVNILLIYVIPIFVEMIVSSGGNIPLPTKIVMAASDFSKTYGLIMLAVVCVFVLAVMIHTKNNEKAAEKIDRLKLRIPIFGKVIKQILTARFSRTLSTLITSGMPVLAGMDICSRTIGNMLVKNILEESSEDIRKGYSIGLSLEKRGVFPTMLTQMIRIGEETGTLDEILVKTSDFYDDEVQTATDQLTTMMTPIITIFLGLFVGFIVLAMITPMFDMYSAVSSQ